MILSCPGGPVRSTDFQTMNSVPFFLSAVTRDSTSCPVLSTGFRMGRSGNAPRASPGLDGHFSCAIRPEVCAPTVSVTPVVPFTKSLNLCTRNLRGHPARGAFTFLKVQTTPGDLLSNTSEMFERDAIPHMEALERFAYGLCHDVHWSRDLVQETMLKAFIHFEMFRQGTNCKAWLFKICRYSFINAYRSRQRQPILMDFDDDAAHSGPENIARYQLPTRGLLAGSSSVDPHSRNIGDEVMTALQGLPLVFQTAVILSDIEGHPYEEIAEFLHVPLGTVRSRLHRGRGMLARRLTGYAREAGYRVVS